MPQTMYEQVAPNVKRARVVETAEEQATRLAAEDLRSRVIALAQSAVGVPLADLTAAQVKALLAVLLWSHGAVDNELKVRPLSEWVKSQ